MIGLLALWTAGPLKSSMHALDCIFLVPTNWTDFLEPFEVW